jgi:two-component system, LytTR family, sensor kinase
MRPWARVGRRTETRSNDGLGLASRQTVYDVLAFANRIAPPLRSGLSAGAVTPVVAELRAMLSARAVVIADTHKVLGWDADDDLHAYCREFPMAEFRAALQGDHPKLAPSNRLPGLQVVFHPLEVDGHIAGGMAVYAADADLALVAAAGEVARWVSTQVQLGDIDRARATAAGAQLRALRAQISPHFLFNALNTIASFVRTDPDRARDLLVEFADFARYSFSTTGQFTTLADELRAIDTFVALERARFGDRLTVRIRVAPEVLGVKVPFLVLQPLVENALQHGLYKRGSQGTLTIDAVDLGSEAIIQLEDNGVGMDPVVLSEVMSGQRQSSGIGIRNVDERLRTVYGPGAGLVIETNHGAGTRVTFTIPKTLPAEVVE